MIKICKGPAVRNFAWYLAISVNLEDERDMLGMWSQNNEGAKFRLHVLTDLRDHGVNDVRGWPDRLARSNRSGLSQHLGADRPGPPGSLTSAVRARARQSKKSAST